jgi:hypothetical protein
MSQVVTGVNHQVRLESGEVFDKGRFASLAWGKVNVRDVKNSHWLDAKTGEFKLDQLEGTCVCS